MLARSLLRFAELVTSLSLATSFAVAAFAAAVDRGVGILDAANIYFESVGYSHQSFSVQDVGQNARASAMCAAGRASKSECAKVDEKNHFYVNGDVWIGMFKRGNDLLFGTGGSRVPFKRDDGIIMTGLEVLCSSYLVDELKKHSNPELTKRMMLPGKRFGGLVLNGNDAAVGGIRTEGGFLYFLKAQNLLRCELFAKDSQEALASSQIVLKK
jgi:hypothetical protein